MCASFVLLILLSLLLHHLLSYKNEIDGESNYQWLRLFSMLSGKVIPAKIGLTKEEDLMQIIKRFVQFDYI
jgi:hypothetical protein